MARGSSSLIVRLLLWLLFLVAAAVVAFFVGYLIGPYVVTHVFRPSSDFVVAAQAACLRRAPGVRRATASSPLRQA